MQIASGCSRATCHATCAATRNATCDATYLKRCKSQADVGQNIGGPRHSAGSLALHGLARTVRPALLAFPQVEHIGWEYDNADVTVIECVLAHMLIGDRRQPCRATYNDILVLNSYQALGMLIGDRR